MPIATPAEYKAREVRDWLVMADSGRVALPSFQRSYVWDNARIAKYLKALYDNRPTGIFLTLQTQDRLSFESRTLKGVDANPRSATELVLDGQQRLTSLWNALKGTRPHKFYAKVKDLRDLDLAVKGIEFYSVNSVNGRAIENPRNAYKRNLVPIEVLEETLTDSHSRGKIWHWCEAACGDGAAAGEIYDLVTAIKFDLGYRLLRERDLHYCLLPADTDTNVAIKIFVETNRSSATIKMFDIVVAVAQAAHHEDLRNRILNFQNSTPIMAHYFSRDEQKMIPEIGEWLLKVACLRVRKVRDGESVKECKNGLPPKAGNYEKALHGLFEDGRNCGLERFNKLQQALKVALNFVAQRGGFTKRTLPAWPPVHVIAALQDDLDRIRIPEWRATADKLISAYLWRSFLTDRYEAQANDRLHADYRNLRKCLSQIGNTGNYTILPPIFDDREYPPPSEQDLKKPLQWIGRGRLGPAIAAVATHNTPQDWVSIRRLDVNTVRDLEDRRKLDRHHVFPKKYLRGHVGANEIDHGLNGVLISKEGNIALGTRAPDVYLKKILDKTHGLSEDELRSRIESHLVPYDALKRQGTPKSRYRHFIKQRAKIVSAEIDRLVTP